MNNSPTYPCKSICSAFLIYSTFLGFQHILQTKQSGNKTLNPLSRFCNISSMWYQQRVSHVKVFGESLTFLICSDKGPVFLQSQPNLISFHGKQDVLRTYSDPYSHGTTKRMQQTERPSVKIRRSEQKCFVSQKGTMIKNKVNDT